MVFHRSQNGLNPRSARWRIYSLCSLILMVFSACNPGPTQAPATATPALTDTIAPSATLVATSTPTPLPAAVLLVAPDGADPALSARLRPALEQLASQSSLRLLERSSISAQDVTPEVKVVVALPPLDGLQNLASASPSTQFIALGITGLSPAPNLSLISTTGQADQQGFMAGAIAAILTEDWRVGVISVSDTPAGKAAALAFKNGVVYFCGLCRPYDPPFVAYPVIEELPSDASQSDWENAVQTLAGQAVKTAYIFPGAGDDAMLSDLDQAGIHVIGGVSPASAHTSNWVGSLQADFLPALQKAWPQVLSGNGGLDLLPELSITDVNVALFSPGRQALAAKILSDLQAGLIDTQVDAQTGNPK